MKNPYRSTAHGIARIGVGRVSKPKTYKPPRPYTRRPRVTTPRINDVTAPVTQTPTITGTGVTTTSGGTMPGAPDTGGLPAIYQAPKIKNWKNITPAQYAQATLAPEYASLYAQQHQQQLIAGQQRSAITSYGADLAKILGEAGPAGVKGTLGPEYAAALSMANLRQFAYTQFLESQKYADAYAQIAAKYPSIASQWAAQQADQKLKQDAFNLQKVVAVQAYHLNQLKTKGYLGNLTTQAKLGAGRLAISQGNLKIAAARYGLSVKQYKLQAAKATESWKQWNQTQGTKATKVNVSLSKLYGFAVNDAGQRIPGAPKIPKTAVTGKGIDTTRSKELGYWVYNDLSRVPKPVLNRKGLPPTPPSRYQPNGGSGGYTPSQVQRWKGQALQAARRGVNGWTDRSDPDNPITYPPIRWGEYLLRAEAHGIPKRIAIAQGKRIYPRNKRGG